MEPKEAKQSKEFTIQEPPVEPSDITRIIGSFGIWQLRIVFVLALVRVFMATHFFAISFFAPRADHWCRPPADVFSNWTVEEWKNYSLPPDKKSPTKYSSCTMYDRSYSSVPGSYSLVGHTENLTEVDCKFGWDYDTSIFKHSLENEYDLVCKREALAKTGSALFNAGVMLGSLVAGQASDIYGRKLTMMVLLIIGIVSAIVTAFMPSLELFFLTRFIIASSFMGCFCASFVLYMEFLDQRWRSIIGMIGSAGWGTGQLILTGLAYAVPDWRSLQLLISVPILAYILFWWFVPESIRWLMSKGKVEEAKKIAEEAVRVNKRNVDVDLKSVFNKEENLLEEKKTLLDLLRSRKLRKATFLMYYNWFATAFVYYGISLGTKSLGGDLFVTFGLAAAAEFPAYILCTFVMLWFGRRSSSCFFMMLGGLACLATAFFEKGSYHNDWPIVTLALIGKFAVTSNFLTIYIFSIELFPTCVRNVGLGSSSFCARIGSIIAPFIDLLRLYHPAVPLVLYGVVAVSTSLLSLMLPETKDKAMPQTFEEAEK